MTSQTSSSALTCDVCDEDCKTFVLACLLAGGGGGGGAHAAVTDERDEGWKGD